MWARVTQEGGKVEGARKGKRCSINGGCLHTYTLYIFIQGENISVIKLITKKCLTKGELLYMFAGCESEKNWSIPFLKLAIVSWFLVAQGRLFHKMAPLQLMLHLRGRKGHVWGGEGRGWTEGRQYETTETWREVTYCRTWVADPKACPKSMPTIPPVCMSTMKFDRWRSPIPRTYWQMDRHACVLMKWERRVK